MELFLLLIVPLLIALGGFVASAVSKNRRYLITFREFLCIVGVVCAVIVLGYFISRMASTHDNEVWNGRVVKKEQERVSCEHSYTCNCMTICSGSGSNESCTTVCQTCYEHANDWDWALYTSNDERLEIDRIDRRGSKEPPRFTAAKKGDPTALVRSYTNYVKANPWSILRREGALEKFKSQIPAYPIDVRDYHYVDRFVNIGGKVPAAELQAWNRDLMEINADLGKKKQVNIVFVVTPTNDSSYIHALEEAWLGGKKNDLVVIFGVTEYPKIDWVRVMSWSRAEELKITLRDILQHDIGSLDKREAIISATKELTERYFVRTRMREFEYLMAGVRPPTWALVMLMIVGTGLSVGLTVYFWREDPFESGREHW